MAISRRGRKRSAGITRSIWAAGSSPKVSMTVRCDWRGWIFRAHSLACRFSTSARGMGSSPSRPNAAAPVARRCRRLLLVARRRLGHQGGIRAGAPGARTRRSRMSTIDVMDSRPNGRPVRRRVFSRRAVSHAPSAPGARAGCLGHAAAPLSARRAWISWRHRPAGDRVLSGPRAEQRPHELVGTERPGSARHAARRGLHRRPHCDAGARSALSRRPCRLASTERQELPSPTRIGRNRAVVEGIKSTVISR